MEKDGLAKSEDISIEKEGVISQSLSKDGIPNQSLPDDHIGIENISVEPSKLYEAVSALRKYGFIQFVRFNRNVFNPYVIIR